MNVWSLKHLFQVTLTICSDSMENNFIQYIVLLLMLVVATYIIKKVAGCVLKAVILAVVLMAICAYFYLI